MGKKKLKVVRGSEEHRELMVEWLKSQGATDSSEMLGRIYDECYYFVVDGCAQWEFDSVWVWDFIDYEVVELEPKPKHTFQPFDKVLVRDTPECSNFHKWEIALFGRIDEQTGKYIIAGGGEWDECIPYEGNEHLLGTTDNPKKGGER